MKIAIIGSRGIEVDDVGKYLPEGVTEIVSGGAAGVDACAKRYALENGIIYTEFLPEYSRYKRGAPLRRNLRIIEYSDIVIAFWNGKSKGTKFIIDNCKRLNKDIRIIVL